ncbi:encapsulin-associated ferritin-like protein [Peristeroidobacter soli]|jgi:ferritin-like protein|uniref:encapsulin-associated ferritin-like protein n=1 Tax=Peristeroidobacter soli TaxID=2497877 RepID=UPI00101BBCA5|nr:ferritin-like domain-containing protein [Peristeroidobacter soli]
MSSESLHESAKALQPETIDRHRAVSSLMEELEAVDWYDQRIDAATDEELKRILAHNRDEEKEHAAMVLEWLRRKDPKLDEHLRTYLFTDKSVLDIEHEAEHGGADGGTDAGNGCLGIGSLRGEHQNPTREVAKLAGTGIKP